MRRAPLAALVPLALAATPLVAQDADATRLELEARLWAAALSGEVQAVESDLGTIVDLESDLGLEDDEAIEGRLILRPSGRTRVHFAWARFDIAGDELLSRTIEFGGQTFTLTTRIVSAVDLDYGRAGFAWQFLGDDAGRWRLGPLVEVKGIRGEATLEAPDIPLLGPVTEEFEAAVGAAGAALDVEPSERLRVFAEATVVVGSDEGDATDFEAGLRFSLTDAFALVGGYRSFSVEAREEDDTLDVDFDGAFAGLQLRF
ncbi:MAG: hypothetical protein ACRD0X_03280 [Thermoanaerobaculia bacterium]